MRESLARAAHLLDIRMRASGCIVFMFANARTRLFSPSAPTKTSTGI
jgi:hypothetical protein